MNNGSDFTNLRIDDTLYYRDIGGKDKIIKIKCKYCNKIQEYRVGEMIYRHNKYTFCDYNCRSKWRKAHPFAKPHNPYIIATASVFDYEE